MYWYLLYRLRCLKGQVKEWSQYIKFMLVPSGEVLATGSGLLCSCVTLAYPKHLLSGQVLV